MKMGVSLAYPIADFDDLDGRCGAALVRSISLSDGDHEIERTAFRSQSFNGCDSELTVLRKRNTSEKKLERSQSKRIALESKLSFKTPRAELENQFFGKAMSFKDAEAGDQSHLEREALESKLSFKTPTAELENQVFGKVMSFKDAEAGNQSPVLNYFHANSHLPSLEQGNQRYEAALRLQKVYKSFRTRRRLADCAVLAEQRWWKVLDFAELKRSSISFFDIDKNESALSRWSRARTRAAKVGKGLSKDEKARKLALQHWLEAIDPRHRYGHNLQFYYVKWLHCDSKQPFFYWLDIGDGKEVNLERCNRSKLQQQCIKYLGPKERVEYEVVIENAKFICKKSGSVLDTTGGPKDTKWIFVLSTSKTLYVGQKNKGTFQHSSFLAGGATLSAGRLVVEDGTLKAVWPHSGHYLPTEENFEAFMSFLEEHNVDLTNVKRSPDEEEEEVTIKKSNILRGNLSEASISQDAEIADAITSTQEGIDSRKQDCNSAENTAQPVSRLPEEVPTMDYVVDIKKMETPPESYFSESPESSLEDGYETAEESLLSEEEFMVPKKNLFDEDDAEEIEKPVPKEKIMKRIDSHKGTKSYQLAQQLSSRWSTGAGPRIGCMRDYPSELQFRVLEHAHLSPRGCSASPQIRSPSCPKMFTPSLGRSPLAP